MNVAVCCGGKGKQTRKGSHGSERSPHTKCCCAFVPGCDMVACREADVRLPTQARGDAGCGVGSLFYVVTILNRYLFENTIYTGINTEYVFDTPCKFAQDELFV